MARSAVLLDADGTLVDSTYHHALAWKRAFASHGFDVPTAWIHRRIGQGSGQLMEALVGEAHEDVKKAWRREFDGLRAEVRLLPGAREVVRELAGRGLAVVLATSSEPEDVQVVVAMLDVGESLSVVTSAGDVEQAKPEPDVVTEALAAAGVGAGESLAVGDSVWDVEAARRAGVDCVCVTTGGTSEPELREAGALAVYPTLVELAADLNRGPLARLLARDA
jgi:HAD superfamily hydrolase (TIGR01549 family)